LATAEQPLAVLFPRGHPLAGRRTVRLTDLTQAQWIDASDTAIPLERLRAVCRTDGFRPRIRHRGTDLHGLAALAAAGLGLTALPLSPAATLPGLTAVPVDEPRLVHRTELVHAVHPTATARQLAGLLVDEEAAGDEVG
ncbi:LysR substrate-binding domain-containing protein, partial [Streptomyces carpinensis]